MSTSRFIPKTVGYLVPYVLIATFQYQVAQDGLKYSSPFVLMGLRYLIASLILFGVVRSFRPIVNKDTVLLSIVSWASSGFWILGLEYVSPSESAVLSYTMPLIAIPLSYLLLSEKASHKEWIGAGVGFVGVLVYSFALFENQTLSVLGAVLTLSNAFFWGMYTIYYRKLKNQEATMTVATQLLFGALFFFLIIPLGYRLEVTPNFLFDLAYLSVLNGALYFLLWNAIVRLQSVGKTSTLIYSIPITVTVAQYLETSLLPPPVSLIGICLMIFGISVSRFW
ncbi:MAG: DMT family transporter [Candidatus Bathyarchaeia archaeon]